MAGLTPFYGLSYFTFGDELGDGINVQREIDRFLVIDKQLYGLYAIFGNGAISGWDLSLRDDFGQNTISLNVSPGIGIINSLAVQTSTTSQVEDLPPNETVGVYAILTSGTVRTRDVLFAWSRTIPSGNAVLLANVTVGEASVTSIDTSVRQEIGFLELIKQEVANHKHRGSPSKIDLQTETRNQLPGARLEDIDTAKITSGRLNPERIPQLEHGDLANTGLLPHAALDSFTRLITSGNRQLLGEVTSVDVMKLITAQYYVADKLNLNLSDLVDFPNLLVCYPGITPNTIMDLDASTAAIDLVTNCISGKPVKQGSISSILWKTNSAFFSAYDRSNVSIALNTVTLTRGGGSSTEIEDFEQVPRAGVPIPGFSTEVQVVTDDVAVTSEDVASFRTEGFYSGRFDTNREYRLLYTRTLTQNKDWSIYDELILDVKSIAISHGAVYMYFINGEGDTATKSQSYLVLGQDEITDNVDPLLNSFERRVFDISKETKNDVRKIVFYTDDSITKQVFWVDNIFVRNQNLFPPSGYIRFRYSSSVPVTFNSINYESIIPDGCDVRIRIRVANSSALLTRAIFTPNLRSGDVFAMQGTDAEIDVILTSNTTRDKTPTLKSLELQIIVDSSVTGFTIGTAEEWDRGEYINEQQKKDDFNPFISNILLQDPISVGDLYYIYQNGVNENSPTGDAVYGFRGLLFKELLSPLQAINVANVDFAPGFKNPFSVYRLENRNFIVADTVNDRVIETTPTGEFVRGIGGHNATDSAYFYPLTAVYNTRKGTLTICFSQSIQVDKIDITKIKIWIGSAGLLLGSQDTILDNGKNDKILEILLTNDKIDQLTNPDFDVNVDLLAGFLPTPFSFPASAARLIGSKGLAVFLGDFIYMNEINRPIYSNVLANGNWMIGNSSIVEDSVSQGSTTNITIAVGDSTTFTVTVDPPTEGYQLTWETTIPAELQQIITFDTPLPGNQGTVHINSPTESQIRTWQVLFTAVYVETATGLTVGTTVNTVVVNIIAATDSTTDTPSTFPSTVEIDFNTESVAFSYSALSFSDFTLGAINEIDSDKIMISGLLKESDPLPAPQGGDTDETYEEQAVRKLEGYRGKTIILNKKDRSITFEYIASDNSYPSDAIMDSRGYVVIAETSFIGNSGRVIKVDNEGNIVWQIGGGLLSKVNDVRARLNGHVIVST